MGKGENTTTQILQNAATTNVNGLDGDLEGYTGPVYFEINETLGGTCTITPQVSFDGTTWYTAGFQPISATLAPARTITAISVTASLKQTYQLLDLGPQVRFPISASAAQSVTVKLYAVTA